MDQSAPLDALRAGSLLAEKFWGRIFAGVAVVTNREKGEAALLDIWLKTLGSHQKTKYLEGLKKLGIREDEPPAVKACKYHYFTNLIGGLKMEYIEESPRKCWIRYLAPMWTYSGLTMLAMPPHVRRYSSSAWHARNGQLMGCDRLQWVKTKTITEGDPYDEGYWIEHDHPIKPEESHLLKVELRTPEFDPAKAPQLDPEVWPEERKLKARPKFAGGYVSSELAVLLSMYGVETTAYIVGQTMRGLAIQYIHELKADQKIEGNDLHAVTAVFSGILAACRQDYTLKKSSPTKSCIVLRSFKPFDWEVPQRLRDALFEFQRIGVRILNGRIKVSRSTAPDWGAIEQEVWEFEDAGHWLW